MWRGIIRNMADGGMAHLGTVSHTNYSRIIGLAYLSLGFVIGELLTSL